MPNVVKFGIIAYVINQNKSVGQTQKQTTNESIEAGADQTIARYTVVLALFTAVLAGVGIFQGYLTAQQIRLARNEFNATHRPRIRIRQVFMPNLVFVTDHLSHGDNFEISIVVANVGDGEACIIDSRCRVFFYRDEAQVGQYVYRNPPLHITNEVIVLGVGESRTFTITDIAEMRPAPPPDMRIMRQFMAEKWKCLFSEKLLTPTKLAAIEGLLDLSGIGNREAVSPEWMNPIWNTKIRAANQDQKRTFVDFCSSSSA